MQISKILPIFFVGVALFSSPVVANAANCSLDGVILNCSANGKSASDIMAAFASDKTREVLSTPLAEKERFKQNGDLEKFRSSMEKNWRKITRLARQQERNKNRRRLSEAKFQIWVKEFAEAEKSYAVALNFYRQLHWQDVK